MVPNSFTSHEPFLKLMLKDYYILAIKEVDFCFIVCWHGSLTNVAQKWVSLLKTLLKLATIDITSNVSIWVQLIFGKISKLLFHCIIQFRKVWIQRISQTVVYNQENSLLCQRSHVSLDERAIHGLELDGMQDHPRDPEQVVNISELAVSLLVNDVALCLHVTDLGH